MPKAAQEGAVVGDVKARQRKIKNDVYEAELARLQIELIKLQEWVIIKYWFSVSDEEQERRFQKRMDDPTRSWKLSPMDIESRSRWVEYSQAKDEMFEHTDIKQAPWHVVNADSKKRARLNCITHLLSQIAYKDLTPAPPHLPPRPEAKDYVRPPFEDQNFVPEIW